MSVPKCELYCILFVTESSIGLWLKIIESNFLARYILQWIKLLSTGQADNEHCQWWGTHNFSVTPVGVSHQPHCRKISPFIQSKPTLCLKALPLVLSLQTFTKSLSPWVLYPLYIFKSHNNVSPETSLLRARRSYFSQESGTKLRWKTSQEIRSSNGSE